MRKYVITAIFSFSSFFLDFNQLHAKLSLVIKENLNSAISFFPSGATLKLIGVPREQRADIGANVTFTCTAKGFPIPNISWIKNNASFALQSNPRLKLINHLLNYKGIQSQLFITGVSKEDFGGYQCEAKNIVGKKLSFPAFLTLKGDTCHAQWFIFLIVLKMKIYVNAASSPHK